MGAPFLTARWENLILLNFDCPAALLRPYVPVGTRLDAWGGAHVLSLVGFLFADTRLLGVPVPFHRTFEDVNLRFYVRREMPDGQVRRGVVFIKELVPLHAVAFVARLVYNENYVAAPMDHRTEIEVERGGSLEYGWRHGGGAHLLAASVEGPARPLESGSEAEFITEHYWGYTRQRDGGTLEYRVEHPRWWIWEPTRCAYTPPGEPRLYRPEFAEILEGQPRSAFVAAGSEVTVHRGARLRARQG